jgi:hypothetical protein
MNKISVMCNQMISYMTYTLKISHLHRSQSVMYLISYHSLYDNQAYDRTMP